MSFTANTAFEARITNNEYDVLSHVAGLYKYSDAVADCDAGRLVVASALAPCEGFSGVYNENTHIMVDATDAATIDDPIFACDTYDTQLIGVGAKNYFIGSETLGLGVPAGRYGNFTRIKFDGQSLYRFGAGNFSTTVSTNRFATIDDGKLVPAATAPATGGTPYFKIVGTGKFVEGNEDTVTYYDVVACAVTFAS